MDFISNYDSLPISKFQQILTSQKKAYIKPLSVTQQSVKKINRLLSGRFTKKFITFNQNLQNPQIQFQFDQNDDQSVYQEEQDKIMKLKQISDNINFSIIQKTKLMGYQIFINFSINFQRGSFCYQSTIIKNYKVIQIQSKSLMKFMARYFVSYNAKLQYGSFSVHPLLRKIGFCIYNHTSLDQMSFLIRNPLKFVLYIIQQQIKKITQTWNNAIQPILYLINKRSYQQSNLSKKYQFFKGKINKINTMIIHSHIDAYFFIQNKAIPRFKKIQDQQRNYKLQQTKAEITSMQNRSRFLKQIHPMISLLIGKQKMQSSIFKYPQWQSAQVRQLSQNLACIEYGGKFYNIFININSQRVKIDFKIYMIDGIMKRQGQLHPSKSRIVKKVTQQKRYNNQIQVLKLLHKQKCLFFPRYFFCQQQQFKQTILVEYIPESSIDRYLSTKATFIGNQTKLFFLFEIIVALRFLRDNSIVHIDLKPQNVLIKIVGDARLNVHYLVKVIDFGQSYSSKVDQLSIKSSGRGFTIPYASPQLLSKGKRFDQKTDVFSFGVIMYEIMFDHFPIEIMKLDKANIINEQYLKFFSLPYQKLSSFGTQDIMLLLYYICLKCLQPEPNDRPTLDWLNIILKDIVLLYEQLTK